MIGIIPSGSQTFIVEGTLDSNSLIDGRLYVDPETDRLFFYSIKETRSSPITGYFPIWDGKTKIISQFSNQKYFNLDATRTEILSMSSNINENIADQVLYQRRRSERDEILEPLLIDGDNMFTQCIKGILNAKKYTLIDLVDMSTPPLPEKTI